MSSSTVTPADEAASTLASVRLARKQTRGDLRSYWYPLVVFGLLTMLSTPFFSLWDGAGVGLFWLAAVPLGVAAIARHYRSRESTVGVARNAGAYQLTAGLLVVACFGLGFGGGLADERSVAEYGPPLAVCCAYVVFAWLERSIMLLGFALTLAAATILCAVSNIAYAAHVLAFGYGASLLILGLVARSWTKQH